MNQLDHHDVEQVVEPSALTPTTTQTLVFSSKEEIQVFIKENYKLIAVISNKVYIKLKIKGMSKLDFFHECIVKAFSALEKLKPNGGINSGTANWKTYLTRCFFNYGSTYVNREYKCKFNAPVTDKMGNSMHHSYYDTYDLK